LNTNPALKTAIILHLPNKLIFIRIYFHKLLKNINIYCNYSAYQNMSIDVDSDENVENNK
jgi:hypothetical protein